MCIRDSYEGVGLARLDAAGDVTFTATLPRTIPGITSANNSGFWQAGPAGINLVVREGDQAPGLPDGYRFGSNSFSRIATNSAGQLVVNAEAIIASNASAF